MLAWSDPEHLAYALHGAYPHINQQALSPDDVFNLVLTMPRARDLSPLRRPDPRVLQDILGMWSRYAATCTPDMP